MDEEISIIDNNTRNQKIRNFLINNKKILLFSSIILVLIILGFYSYQIYQNRNLESLSNKYHNAIVAHKNGDGSKIIKEMKEVIEFKNSTYSPLAIYYLIDENLIKNRNEINNLFDILIDKTTLDDEIKNLIIYKKALYNADYISENELLKILNPIINSNSVWRSHGLYLMAEYFYYNDEKEKSKEFFNQILNTENANPDIIQETQKRLNRDLSE